MLGGRLQLPDQAGLVCRRPLLQCGRLLRPEPAANQLVVYTPSGGAAAGLTQDLCAPSGEQYPSADALRRDQAGARAIAADLAYFRSQLSERLTNVPAADLIVILVGLPVIAAASAWLLSGRQPPALSRRPLD
jgi:hypothetical protein